MDWSNAPLILLRLSALLAGLLLPGALLLRWLALPRSLAGSFLLSATILYLQVLALALTHAPITWLTLACGPVLVALVISGLLLRRGKAPALSERPALFPYFAGMGRWLPLFLMVVAVLVWRLCLDPLSGPDVRFRWSYLAEQMLRVGTLDFYPAVTAPDYLRYFWPESIPPGIASLYAWVYACGGCIQPQWTIPVLALQLLSLFELVWTLAHSRSGEAGARWAVLMAAACPLLLWTYLLGQETGQLTLGVLWLVLCVKKLTHADSTRWLWPATAAATVAASAREYGFLFALLGLAVLLLVPGVRRQALCFALSILPGTLLWPWHCWQKTGNPFYSLEVGGWFSVNREFTDWNHHFLAGQQSALHRWADWASLERYLVLWALPAGVGLALLLWKRRAGWRVLLSFIMLSAGLWYLSVPLTGGGLFYSLRVLCPALALLVVAAGIGMGETLPRPTPIGVALLLGCFFLESIPKTLVLPENPYRVQLTGWLSAGHHSADPWHVGEDDMRAKLAALPAEAGIVSDNFDLPRLAAEKGRAVAPLWTPQFAWFFDRTLTADEAAVRWRASGIRYLVIGQTGATLGFLQEAAHWNNPRYSLRVVGVTPSHYVLEIAPRTALP